MHRERNVGKMQKLKVTSNEAGQRLDKLLAKYLNLAGKSFIYKMMRKKNITLNGKKCDGSEHLTEGDEIKLFLAEETIEKFSEVKIQKVQKKKLDIVYEDEHILLINKPSGMLSQKAKETDESLVEYLIDYLLDSGHDTDTLLVEVSFYTLNAGYNTDRFATLEETLNNPLAYCFNLEYNVNALTVAMDMLRGTPDTIESGDWVAADYLADEFKRTEKIDLKRDKAAMLRVREAAEKAKRELSGQMSTQVTLPFLTQDANGPHHLDVTVTRAQFEGMTRDLVERTCGPVSQVMTDAALSMSELGQVLLVGGSTRMPAVQEMVKKLTGKTPARNVNPDECVAMGAALQGGKLAAGNGMTVASAAQSVILMDVAPLSLSIETVGGVATKIIDRNTTIPTRHSQIFTTAAPFQTAVDIKVLQGERYYARDNKLLGNFRLKGIRRAMAGVPQIEVTFAIDANGIVTVSAKDLGTGNQQEITISSTTNMSEDEIRRAMEDARRYEAQDKARKEATGIRNEAEKLIYETEQALGRDKTIGHEDKRKVKDDISALRKAVNKTKPESITTEQAAEIARLAEALKQSAKAIRTAE